MEKLYMKKNNSGSTLLIVIICLAFVGILGSLMLSVSMVNLQMKRVEGKSKINFYSCETALEEIRTGLEELAVKHIKDEYEYVLKNYLKYATMDEVTRNETIQSEVLQRLNAAFGSDRDVIAEGFKKYLSLSEEELSSSDKSVTISFASKDTITTALPYFLIFKDVKIDYQIEDYSTSITSDLKIKMPSFTFTEGTDTTTYSMEQPYAGFALVADSGIYSENEQGENKITGNVYVGKNGITIRDNRNLHMHKVSMNGNQLITRGTIKVQNTATLTIGDSIRPMLWADNLMTETTNSYLPSYTLTTDLDLNAVCILKDDLTIDGRNSNVSIEGAYVGYSGIHTLSGSAIIINGSGSSLDLSGLSSLVLAGRAHVSIEDSILKNIPGMKPNINIMTGESLAFKSNQRAYLVPGKYIAGVNHNPVTQKDMLGGAPLVQIPPETDPLKLNYAAYIHPWPQQYKIAAKQTALGDITTLRYYYLNFTSGKKADQFLAEYMNKNSDELQTLEGFTLGNVKIHPDRSRIISAGNVMYYNAEVGVAKPLSLQPGKSSSYGDDAAMDKAISDLKFADINYDSVYSDLASGGYHVRDLTNLFSKMTHLLSLSSLQTYQEEDQVVKTSILGSGVAQISSLLSAGYTSGNPEYSYYGSLPRNTWSSSDQTAKSIVVLNDSAEIAPGTYFNGVFIASGDITIGAGAVINGIVISAGTSTGTGDIQVQSNVQVYGRVVAAGDIILNENCSINCNGNTYFASGLTVNDFLKSVFQNNAQILWKIFKNPEVTLNFTPDSTVTDLVDLSNLVTCENWRKNK